MAHLFDAGDAAELVVNVGISIERDGEARPTDENSFGAACMIIMAHRQLQVFWPPRSGAQAKSPVCVDVVITPNHPAAIFEAGLAELGRVRGVEAMRSDAPPTFDPVDYLLWEFNPTSHEVLLIGYGPAWAGLAVPLARLLDCGNTYANITPPLLVTMYWRPSSA